MKQEKRISYQSGITCRPSDFLCKDGDLAECINLTTDTEELKPMVQPEVFMTGATNKIVIVHSFGDQKRYITLNGNVITWGTKNETTGAFTPSSSTITLPGTSDFRFAVIGKFLMVSDNKGLHNYIWKPDSYEAIDYPLPPINFDAYLMPVFWESTGGTITEVSSLFVSGESDGIIEGNGSTRKIVEGKQGEYNDLVIGLYQKNLRSVAQKKCFAEPFVIRMALELYDGTYTNISQPVLLFPSVTKNSYAENRFVTDLKLCTSYCRMFVSQSQDYTDYSDIVKDVVVFASAPIPIYDLGVDQPYELYQQSDKVVNLVAHIGSGSTIPYTDPSKYYEYTQGNLTKYSALKQRPQQEIIDDIKATSIFYKICSLGLKPVTNINIDSKVHTHILENITSQPRLDVDDYFSHCKLYPNYLYSYNSRLHLANVRRGFFEGFDFFEAYDNDSSSVYDIYVTIKTDTGNYTIHHQTEQTRHKMDQFFFYPDARASHVLIQTGGSTVLNVDLTEHKGLNGAYYFAGLPQPSTQTQSRGVNREIIEDGQPTDPNNNNNEGEQILDPNIDDGQGGAGGGTGGNGGEGTGDTENQGGAGGDDTGGGVVNTDPVVQPPSVVNNDDTEPLPNYIIVSEVFNPFTYRSKGYHSIGNGTVIGMATQAQSLGQEEHGLHPLIVFTDRGLVSMLVGSDGQYTNRVDEMPREVCINPACITETDGAVFFVSKKGLMVIVGNQVSCVSENLNGHPFDIATLPGLDAASLADQTLATKDWAGIITACQGTSDNHETLNGFLEFIRSEKCRIAYDYIDSKLLIINPDFGFAYVYSMADNAISKTVLPEKVDNVVNDYPDTIMQQTVGDGNTPATGNVYTLYGKKREDEVTDRQTAFMLTRPMKLGGPLTVSSLMELVNVGMWDDIVEEVAEGETPAEVSCVKTVIWVSDNLKKWYRLSSRFGAAAKYFRIGLFIKMLATERLSGTIIMEDERRTNNLRT